MSPVRDTERARVMRENRTLRAQGKKRCSGCKAPKSLDHFPRNAARADGHSNECSPCGAERSRVRHAANPEAYRRQACKWAKDHPEAMRAKSRKAASARRARVHDAFVEHVDPQIVFERDEGICGVCGDPVDRETFDVDHIIPLAHGGEHSYRNVRLAHVPCNRRRGRSVSLARVALMVNVG